MAPTFISPQSFGVYLRALQSEIERYLRRPAETTALRERPSSASFITDVETALVEAGISVASMCRRAEIAQSSWHRWKADGVTPRDSSRARVAAALASLNVPTGRPGSVAA